MSIAHILFQLFIGPLQLVFEATYTVAKILFSNSGLAIMVLSLAVNILVLPLYKRADAIQADERALQKRMEAAVAHIKRTFTGDERMMILQSYYRQNNYKPWYSLRASMPLLLQVPFFIAAFRFLSNLEELKGMPFGPIADLGAPDAMLVIAGLSINLLPILMTLINIIASAIYARGFSVKEKLQLYGMALIFLVLLYNSPAGLVFYWTLNNVFSLFKNILQKLKNADLIVDAGCALAGFGLVFYALALCTNRGLKMRAAVLLLGIVLLFPMFKRFFGEKLSKPKPETKVVAPGLYLYGCLLLVLLSGLLIPSSVISASPAEFVVSSYFCPPMHLVINALLIAVGCFVVWFGIFYYLADDKIKHLFSLAMWLLSGIAVTNYMFFGTELGLLTQYLKYEIYPVFPRSEQLINLAVILGLCLFMILIWYKQQTLVKFVYLSLCIAVVGMSSLNIISIQKQVPAIRESIENESKEKASFTLSKNGENVIVIMMDKAFNAYLPYAFKENPEYAEQFDGFTYYPNTLGYGSRTLVGVGPIYGGYEYTPAEMNRRSDLSLPEKHEEALMLMPTLFNEAGYEVTLIDPPNVEFIRTANLSFFNQYPYIDAYSNLGLFNMLNEVNSLEMLENWQRNFFCYSLMKISPLALQNTIYRYGTYLDPSRADEAVQDSEFIVQGQNTNQFINAYSFLDALDEVAVVEDEGENRLVIMNSLLTHDAGLLHMPDYDLFADYNSADFYKQYYSEHAETYTVNGHTLVMDTPHQIAHYQANYLMYKLLGQWMDYLRENEVYDNTRIIIVSDHAGSLYQFGDTSFDPVRGETSWADVYDVYHYNPLLLVKDFGSKGFTVDESFMTNADVPLLAMEGIVDDPVNPFTDTKLTDELKHADEHHILIPHNINPQDQSGNTFLPGEWYAVSGDIFNPNNWRSLGTY